MALMISSSAQRISVKPSVRSKAVRVLRAAQVPEPASSSDEGSSSPLPATAASTPAAAAAVPLENKELFSVMGPLQEAINGRAAMLGFVTAFVAERFTHQSVLSQLGGRYVDGEMVEKALGASDISFAFIVAVITLATFAPLVYKGEKPDSRSFGPFSPSLELKVGRVAQLGFLGLVVVEVLKGNTPMF